VEKYGTASQATNDNMAHELFVPDTKVYKHTLRICNTYSFPTTIVVYERFLMLLYAYIDCLVNVY